MTPAPDAENSTNGHRPIIEGEDECGPQGVRLKTSLVECERMKRQGMLQSLNMDSDEVPLYPRFASREERLRSFEHWPAGISVSPLALSDAGFFYSSQGDRTFCYQCGGMLEGWCASDNPWDEHSRWYPTCKLVTSLRGNMITEDSAVAEFRQKARAQEDMKEAITTIRDLVASIDVNKVNPSDMKSAIESLKVIVSEVDTGNDNFSVHENYDDDSDDNHTVMSEGSESSSSSSNPKSLSCIVCLTGARNALLLPCHHIATCTSCASKLKNCCVCRLPVKYHTRVFIS